MMSTPPTTPHIEFATALVEIGRRRKLGQRDIATLSGIDESHISRIIRGLQGATNSTAASIIQVFDGEDQRTLTVAWLHDAIRALGFPPQKFPIGSPREPALADLADPALADTIRTLLQRLHSNPAIRGAIHGLEEISRVKPADPQRRLRLSKKVGRSLSGERKTAS